MVLLILPSAYYNPLIKTKEKNVRMRHTLNVGLRENFRHLAGGISIYLGGYLLENFRFLEQS